MGKPGFVPFGDRWINPVLYAEYADLDGADKTLPEVAGRDGCSLA